MKMTIITSETLDISRPLTGTDLFLIRLGKCEKAFDEFIYKHAKK